MPNGSIDPTLNYVADLSGRRGLEWPTIAAAHAATVEFQTFLYENLCPFTSGDVDVIVFGSLARREWTSGSDVDWTLLIDGQVNADHRIMAREVEKTLRRLEFQGTPLQLPGNEGIFGKMAFSHDIVHHIGGQADSNRNTTQRILLLLEAAALTDPKQEGKVELNEEERADSSQEGSRPFERVLRQILNRYLRSDSNFHMLADTESRIPRFLLNDIVRYWRTICVDFAYKEWEQAGKKWALRNIKLRTSRKLLFVSGLFTVFSCFQNDDLRREDADMDSYVCKLQRHLLNFAHSTPLNIIVWTLTQIGLEDRCLELLNEYEQFLAKINDATIRKYLAALSEQSVYGDDEFLECREISRRLQAVLQYVCFEADSPLRRFTCEYGVF
jgi:predicted nucleotidyltransferase